MGSPEFALPALRALAKNWEVVGVLTQPDRPFGRGRVLRPPPVKALALELGLPWIQPEKLNRPEVMDQLGRWAPDLIVVTAFGQILRPDVLALPKRGSLNIHASLLPRWRGAAPIQAVILAGESLTGVTIMKMDPGIDTGPLLAQSAIRIEPADTAGSLSDKLSLLGAELIVETVPRYLTGELPPEAQEESQASYAPLLKKEDGRLDFNLSGEELLRRIRAFDPWPGAFFQWDRGLLKVRRARLQMGQASPGQRLIFQGSPAVGTRDALLVLEEVQPEGRKSMTGTAFLSGAKSWEDAKHL